MKLARKLDKFLILVVVCVTLVGLVFFEQQNSRNTFAVNEGGVSAQNRGYFVTFDDEGERLTVKTTADTVGEAVRRAGIILNESDEVTPGLEAKIDANNFLVTIRRPRPVIVSDGTTKQYVMTANVNERAIAKEAGFTVYDGDKVAMALINDEFMEVGAAQKYEITRNGGRLIVEAEEIPFGDEEVKDYNLTLGTREIRQQGENGVKLKNYEVYYEDGVEVRRDLVGETVEKAPVNRVVAVGAKAVARPEAGECREWARQAGVAEGDLDAAVDLIYHESGCRVNATNASSGAYGIPQALPGSKMASAGADWETNPVTQIRWMTGYVTGRYGGWQQALSYWYAHGWY